MSPPRFEIGERRSTKFGKVQLKATFATSWWSSGDLQGTLVPLQARLGGYSSQSVFDASLPPEAKAPGWLTMHQPVVLCAICAGDRTCAPQRHGHSQTGGEQSKAPRFGALLRGGVARTLEVHAPTAVQAGATNRLTGVAAIASAAADATHFKGSADAGCLRLRPRQPVMREHAEGKGA